MPRLAHTFPFPSRTWMVVNLAVYFTFAVLIPVELGREMLYARDWLGLALWASAVVNGGLAIAWLRYFDRLRETLARPDPRT